MLYPFDYRRFADLITRLISSAASDFFDCHATFAAADARCA